MAGESSITCSRSSESMPPELAPVFAFSPIVVPRRGNHFPVRKPDRSLNYVREYPPSTCIGDRHLGAHPVPGEAGDQHAADLPVPLRRAAERGGFGFLSRRQRRGPGRLRPDHPRAGHQRRAGHALHGLGRHQRRRGSDPDHLRAGHGPERGGPEREQPDPDRQEPAPAHRRAGGDHRHAEHDEHADVCEHLQHG